MRTKLTVVVTVATFLLGMSVLSAAQEQPGPLAWHYVVKVKTSNVDAFENASRKHVEWRRNEGDPWDWATFYMAFGEGYAQYIIHSGGHNWSDFDEYMVKFAALTAKWREDVGPYVEELNGYIVEVELDLTHWPDDPSYPNLMDVTRFKIKPTHYLKFRQMLAKIHEASVKGQRYYGWASVRNGGEGSAMMLVEPHKNWADFKDPDKNWIQVISEAYGEEEAMKLVQGIMESIDSMDSWVYVFRPDLSLIHEQ